MTTKDAPVPTFRPVDEPPPERRTLKQLREAAGLSREQIGVVAALSNHMVVILEDMPLHEGGISKYLESMGGDLELTAIFPDGRRVILVDP